MLRSLIPCILFCALSALILGQKGAGFMLYVLVPVMLVYMAVSAWRIRKQPQRLPELPLKMLLCLTTISSIAMLHTHYHKQARLEADKIAKQIQTYQQQYHAYPGRSSRVYFCVPHALHPQSKSATQLVLSRHLCAI